MNVSVHCPQTIAEALVVSVLEETTEKEAGTWKRGECLICALIGLIGVIAQRKERETSDIPY